MGKLEDGEVYLIAQPSNSFYKFSANLNTAQGYLRVVY